MTQRKPRIVLRKKNKSVSERSYLKFTAVCLYFLRNTDSLTVSAFEYSCSKHTITPLLVSTYSIYKFSQFVKGNFLSLPNTLDKTLDSEAEKNVWQKTTIRINGARRGRASQDAAVAAANSVQDARI